MNDTTTYADIRATVDAAEAAGLPVPDVAIAWHLRDDVDDVSAADIVRAFPDRSWVAHEGSQHEWVAARNGSIDITAFLAAIAPDPAPARATAVIEAAREFATTVTPEGTPKPVAVSA